MARRHAAPPREAAPTLLLVLLAAVALSGCAATPATTVVTFDGETPKALVAHPDDIAIAQTSARLMRDRLGLPFPADAKIHVYVNQATLADGLVREAGLKQPDAWEKARYAAGVASPRGLFLRGDLMAGMSLLDRVALIAHEIAHVCQQEMRRGGRGSPAIWIREGHAEWVTFHVLDWLQIRPYRDSRAEVERRVLRSTMPARLFPNLGALRDGKSWDDATTRFGGSATYGQAFLAIDWLVEQSGIEKLHEFFRRFARDEDPAPHWFQVYGTPYKSFADEFRARFEALRP